MRAAVVTCLALLLLLGAPTASPGQENAPPPSFGFALTGWNQTLTEISRVAERSDLAPQEIESQRQRLAALLSEVAAAKAQAQTELSPLLAQIEALGPPPAEGEPAETPDVAAQRASLNDRVATLQGHVKQAGLVETRALELDSRLAAYVRGAAVEQLFDRYPYPLSLDTIAVAIPELGRHLANIAVAPAVWWGQLTQGQRNEVLFFRLTVILIFAVGFGWIARRLLLTRLGRKPEIEEPSYARRLTGAIAEALGNGIIPAMIFGGILFRTLEGKSLFTGQMADIVIGFCLAAIILFLVRAAVRAALSPDLPSWRLEDIAPEHARIIARRVTTIAAVYAVTVFLGRSGEGAAVSQEMESFYGLIYAAIQTGLLLSLTRSRLWTIEPTPPQDGDTAAPRATHARFWLLVRLAVIAISVASVAAALFGYVNLTGHLLESLLVSAGVSGGLYLIRGLLREVIGAALRTHTAQERLGLRHPTRNLIKFWTRALLDLALLALGVMILLPVWGMPLADMLRWAGRTLQGITIGNVTISITDLLTGLLVFAVIVLLTRMFQRVLSQRVLPQTTLDSGVQNSLTAGLGYVGIALAAALAISTIGLDLSNLAIIAGALSVGIGFGLQNVVNNFVSGLILLIERPIKVGDWIIAGSHEGYVKRINVRATELETFQRASVIIPNSELISSTVVNWTHKNKLGRVEIPIGVAYHSDVDLVMDTLLGCLKADSRILNWPEPYVVFKNFGDSSLDFEARGYIGDIEQILGISTDMRLAITRAFREKGIEIPFPQRDVNLRDIDRLAEAIASRAVPETGDDPETEDGGLAHRPKRRKTRTVGESGMESGGDAEGDG